MDTVTVHIACPCPPTEQGPRHPDGDDVELRARLSLAGGIAVQSLLVEQLKAIGKALDSAALSGLLAEGYLLSGVAAWTLVDADGKPLPVTPETITERLLSDFAVAEAIADKADDLYMEPVLLPLLRKLGMSSPATPTNGSTSATRSSRARTAKKPSRSTRSSSSTRRPPKPSSTTTTPTASTVTTSVALGGGSSSSRP